MQNIKQRVYDLVREDNQNYRANALFGNIVMGLIVISILLVILETFSGFPDYIRDVFFYMEAMAVAVFSIEYLMRIWTATYLYPDVSATQARLRYARTFMAVIDLLAIVPFYLPFIFPMNLMALRLLRLLRLLRIIKMNRYTTALTSIKTVLAYKAPQLLSSMIAVLLMMVFASLFIYSVEHDAQPGVFENAFSGLWWALATITTVGYGDIVPITLLGKVFGAIIALLGIGLVAVPTGIISAGFIENINKEKETEKEAKHFCPYCGKNID